MERLLSTSSSSPASPLRFHLKPSPFLPRLALLDSPRLGPFLSPRRVNSLSCKSDGSSSQPSLRISNSSSSLSLSALSSSEASSDGIGSVSEPETSEKASIGGSEKRKVPRLEYAIRKESKQSADDNGGSVRKNRERDLEGGEEDPFRSNEPDETEAVDGSGNKRKRAASKKDSLKKLGDSSDNPSNDDIPQGEAEGNDEGKKEKIITATNKGGAVLDQWLSDDIKSQYHVLQIGDDIYDAMLNQTNVGDNNNKFYVIQALESDDGARYMVYNRWGRVGVKGQNNLQGPYTSRESAIWEFEQNFYGKTKNPWSNRKNFVAYPKSYTWLEMDYSEKEEESSVKKQPISTLQAQPQEIKLEPRIAKFVSLICNVSMIKQQMMEIGYNAEKLPLGKLSKSTISKGYEVLKRIADVIGQSDRRTLEQLSGEFYTVIPHDFGFKKMRDFAKLKLKLEMVEALSEIKVATKLLKDDICIQDDPLHSRYKSLKCELMPVDADSDEFTMIEKYMQNTHAKTHSNYTVDINQLFQVSRDGEVDRFGKFSNTKNRMLLWHGSRLTNWTGILSQGLRIAPPEAPVTGYMFGKGAYFADMFSKSANYCYASRCATTGVLLLCEVALGDMAELLAAKYDADKLPEGKLSTKGVGRTAPDFSKARALDDGVLVPEGKPKENSRHQGSLLYNEYIVYNVEQIKMRYLVQVNFNFK